MDSIDSSITEVDNDQRRDACCTSTSSSSGYRLFGDQKPINQAIGDGRVADVILWKRRRLSFGVIVVATVAWFLFERSGLSFISICSDVLLIIIVLLFLWANYAAWRNEQLEELPELVLSEEMVNSAAVSFRVKVNSILSMAHDITLGKDFRLFFLVVVGLWLLSVIGSLVSFFSLAYIGTIIFVTIPALYSRYGKHVDLFAGFLHSKISKQYKIMDETVMSKLPPSMSKDKDA